MFYSEVVYIENRFHKPGPTGWRDLRVGVRHISDEWETVSELRLVTGGVLAGGPSVCRRSGWYRGRLG